MKERIGHMPAKTYARITGGLYLVIIVLGLFSEIAVRSNLVVAGDAAATARNILDNTGLFRAGFAGDLIVFLCDAAVAVLLYVLLREAGEIGSLMAAGFRLTGTAVYGANLLNHHTALMVLSGSEYLGAFDPGQVNAMALLFLDIHKHGYDLGLVFFGVHCLFLGYLLFKSGGFPDILGILMGLAGAGYLIGSFTLFLWPEKTAMVAPVYIAPLIGEVSFCFWLLIRGIRMERAAV